MKKRRRIENTSSASASDSASASACPVEGGEYEVFLSFSGDDTRNGFTDFLYTYLKDAGIRTFRDNNKLPVGGEIGYELVKAIKESKISIPIFSKNYAYSEWCLRELQQMVECHTHMGQKIFPVFYDVKPSEVRKQIGSFGEAFRIPDMNVDNEVVQGWKKALKIVGKLKGLDLKKETNGHEGELVKKVVEKVWIELKKDYTVIPDNLVGIDHQKKELMGMLNVDSNDVRIVGIHGMGGIGKTTIAKVIFNELCGSGRFESYCFLEDVREASQQHNGLVNLQIQLITKILKGKCPPNIFHVDDGVNTIKDRVLIRRVLIVLDDVDDKFQFDKLVVKRDKLRPGSRIIVTTRNKEVLDSLEVCRCYEPPLMNPKHALKLFSKYADHPLDGDDNLSNQAVSMAARLPLALKVIGSLLLGKNKSEWIAILDKLKEAPPLEIQKKLRRSFEALDQGQKQIFLDIACLFIGEDKTNPFYMWEDCKFYPTEGINVLVRRSLIKVGNDNKLRMHDQLRDLGRHIDREENFNEVGERSRFWLHKDALNILKGRMGTKKVVALCLDLTPKIGDYYFTNEEFRPLKNLRFLRVDYADLAGDFESHLLSKLRWLQWRRCPGKFAPTNFYLKNLVILNITETRITDDWEAWSEIKMAEKLKVLDLSHCHGLIAPDFFTYTALERLILRDCRCLVQIGPSIGNLINLKLLDISDCSSIIQLPASIRNLQKLEELEISNCDNLQHILGLPSSLFKLSLLHCASLETLLFCLRSYEGGEFPRLRKLYIKKCPKLERGLPDHLPELTTLEIRNCRQLKDPLPMSPLLCELELIDCSHRVLFCCNDNLQRFYWPCLKEMRISDVSNLKQLPPGLMQRLSAIESVSIWDCPSLESLPISDIPTTLKRLTIERCGKLDLILPEPDSEIQIENYSFASLESLNVAFSSCDPMKSFPLGLFPKLDNLYLDNCINLECFWIPEGVPHDHLTSLRKIHIDDCPKLESFPRGGLPAPNLRYLTIWRCQSLQSLPEGMHNLLSSLESLHIGKCPELESFPEGGLPSNLNSLVFSDCDKLAANRMEWGLQILSNLNFFEFGRCEEVDSFPEEGLLPSFLTSLNISELPNLKYLDKRGLQHLSSLEKISIMDCSKLECLPEGGLPNSLSCLEIDKCSSSLEEWCRRKKEEGWPPIAHIPRIVINGNQL